MTGTLGMWFRQGGKSSAHVETSGDPLTRSRLRPSLKLKTLRIKPPELVDLATGSLLLAEEY
jgi:hypothetical protein